ncbi:MAG: host attachment protein [Bauldia sp.]|nr:host attachment protein [Bauldia sp.]
MNNVRIPHDAWVLVGDGRKALILRNEGDEVHPNLKVESLFEQENPATHVQGADRPGRTNDALGNRSAMEQTDWHRLEEDRFAKEVADRLYSLAHAGRFEALVVVAPPRTLGELRQTLHPEVTKRVVAEVDKDLTGHPVYEIEKVLTGS